MVVVEHPPWSSKTCDLNTYGYAQFSAIPMRREADHCSEMVNQAMLGEPLELLTSKALWTKVRLAHDGYEGWVLTAQLLAIDQLTYRALIEQTQDLVADGINLLEHESPEKTRVVAAVRSYQTTTRPQGNSAWVKTPFNLKACCPTVKPPGTMY